MAGRRRKAFVSLGWISQSRLSGRTGWNGSGLGGSQKAPATPAVTSSAASASQGSRKRTNRRSLNRLPKLTGVPSG